VEVADACQFLAHNLDKYPDAVGCHRGDIARLAKSSLDFQTLLWLRMQPLSSTDIFQTRADELALFLDQVCISPWVSRCK